MRDRGRNTGRREKQASRGKPNVGLDPRTLGSQSEPKVEAQPPEPPGRLTTDTVNAKK